MKTNKPTKTATIKDMRSLTNAAEKHATVAEDAAEKARLYAAAGRDHANVAETAAETARIHADTGREHSTRTKDYSATACFHANRAATCAEDAATNAHTARWCLILTMLINAIILCIILSK